MPIAKRFDVVVLGGGPGGASTASHCAAAGLETLLLERRPCACREVHPAETP
jgi:flavin-dependent dehydrogenase